ncbi:MAG: glycosyltransferase [Clostridiales bacterium]|nr:glycosyltransferase [Clostridiales bacterium]
MDRKQILETAKRNVRKQITGKKVLFITTKELSYIRNSQEIGILENSTKKLTIIGSNSRKYPVRLLKVYWELLRTRTSDFDLIFIGFAPQLVLPFWNFKFKKNRVMIDFFISMYDTFVNDRKRFSDTSMAGKLLKKLDQSTLKKADQILCDTNAHGTYFTDELGAAKEKLMTLYLEADKTIYASKNTSGSGQRVRPVPLQDKFVILYFGSVLPLQGIEVILDAFDRLKDDERFYFYMIGPVDDHYARPESKNIEYIPWLSQRELADHIAMADLCLAGHFNAKIDKAKRTIPGKAYIYQAMEKPMILGNNPANRELFSEEDEHIYFVRMGSGRALKEKILDAYDKMNAGRNTGNSERRSKDESTETMTKSIIEKGIETP